MRKLNTLFPFLLCVVLAVTVISCSKSEDGKDGAQGPAGPAGANGAQGPAGPAGPAGPTGQTGTANVIYSDWIASPAWAPDTIKNGNVVIDTAGWYTAIEAAKMTADILNKGEIKTYINVGTTTNPVVFPLPYSDGLFINPTYFVGGFQLYSNVQIKTGLPVRYILIPGGTAARSAINWNNYAEVKKYLGLKD